MKRIRYYNLADPSVKVTLRTAIMNGIPGAKGLYMPDRIPELPAHFFKLLPGMNLHEIAYEVSLAMLGDDIPALDLREIIERSVNFEIPLKQLSDKVHVLELFHGPTLAFKDTGARFMASLFEYYLGRSDRSITILVATSGDTGSAVASAFFRRRGIQVVILYPSGRVSPVQERMLTTLGENIKALEIDGDFDDCQRLVKESFSDRHLAGTMYLTSANSINFARLFPQSFFYFQAIARLGRKDKPVVLSVPCGNFGNLTAGVLAMRMGLHINHFIASCNANHPVVDYLSSGLYTPSSSLPTISSAMDVGNPSNFPRLLRLFGNSHKKVSETVKGYWFDDITTRSAMRELQSRFGYTSDPHGAVAYLGLMNYLANHDSCGVFLESAHPVKFASEVEASTGMKVQIPDSLSVFMGSPKKSTRIRNRFEDLKNFLLSNRGS